MADTSSLQNYLTDVANSIRNVTGTNNSILANEYDLIINNFILANETSINITPMVNAQHFGPAAGYSGYNSINISAISNTLEPNMTPENIANGVNIFGVTGNMTAGEDLNNELNAQNLVIANLENQIDELSDIINNAGTGSINLSNMNYEETANFIHSSDGSNYSFGIVTLPAYTGGSLLINTNANNFWYNAYKGVQSVVNFDTSNVTTMNNMFNAFWYLVSVPNFNTDNVINMCDMFYDCENLEYIPNFNTTKVTNMCRMLYRTTKLSFDNINFDTSNVIDMTMMCEECYNMINVPIFNTCNVVNMTETFSWCLNITEVPNFNMEKVTTTQRMFSYCPNLSNVPEFYIPNLIKADKMYNGCNNLSNESIINIINTFLNTPNVQYKNLVNTNAYSPFVNTPFDNTYYQSKWTELTAAGWTY